MLNFREKFPLLLVVFALCKPAAAAETRLEPLAPRFSLGGGKWDRFAGYIRLWERAHPRAALRDVLGALDREAKPDCWEGGGRDARERGVAAFCWNDVPRSADDDEDNRYWYPQGLASSGEAGWSGAPARRDILLVTWYRRRDKDSAAHPTATRLSIVDATEPAHVRYRHVALVEPECEGCDGWKTLALHAGGAAWRGRWLYVADTAKGLRVFDLTRFLRAGKGFVLPQVAYYKEVAGSELDFSYASISVEGKSATLLTGEYRDGADGARLVHWPLDAQGRLKAKRGRVRAVRALTARGELTNLQGAAEHGGRYYLVRSRAEKHGTLFVGKPGEPLKRLDEWAVGPEDLSVDEARGRLWNLNEHPDPGRSVFATKL